MEANVAVSRRYVGQAMQLWRNVRSEHKKAIDASDHVGRAVEDIASGLTEASLDASDSLVSVVKQRDNIHKLEKQLT